MCVMVSKRGEKVNPVLHKIKYDINVLSNFSKEKRGIINTT